MPNPKPHWNLVFAGVPSVLPFVKGLAATRYEWQNRDTSAVDLAFALRCDARIFPLRLKHFR
jgi:hypothetical protein